MFDILHLLISYIPQDTRISYSVAIPNPPNPDRYFRFKYNSTWNFIQTNQKELFSSEYDLEIQAPNGKALITMYYISFILPAKNMYSYAYKLEKLLELTKMTRNNVLPSSVESKILIYKMIKNNEIQGYYFMATQRDYTPETGNGSWPIMYVIFYIVEDIIMHVNVFGGSKKNNIFSEIQDMLYDITYGLP
jgi:hypothetical protein